MRAFAMVASIAILAGCSSPASTNSGATTAPSSPAPSPAATQSPESPTPAESPVVSSDSVSSGEFTSGDVVEVTVDRLRLRSKPRVADDSILLEPLLTSLQKAYLYEGPVNASGYTWFRVLPYVDRYPEGWIALASRDGEPWVRHDQGGCDAIGPSIELLARASRGVRLGCWGGGQSVTTGARIVDCNADVDRPQIEPAWFGFQSVPTDGGTICPMLVDADGRAPREPFFAHFDPAGDFLDPLPIDTPIEITGRYDHPAASECKVVGNEGPLIDVVLACRTTFVITAVRLLTGP
jgi:hypothetical protein